MKSYLDCIPCFFEQALRAVRIATDDERIQKQLLDELGKKLHEISLESTPPETGSYIYRKVREITDNPDPYRKLKQKSTEITLSLYPSLKKIIEDSEDSLLTAIRIAIAGNIIDFGPGHSFDIEKTVEDVLEQDFAVCDYEAFRRHLDKSESILYIGDNAGETVFDRLLIEEINKPATYVVRDSPVINDATHEDAVQAGLDKVATIVSSGSDAPGIIPGLCNKKFLDILNSSEFIIAKGQGNYEGLSNEKNTIFFLLKTKCKIIADDIGVANGDIILKGINI